MFICIYRYIYVDSRNAHDLRRLDGAVFLHLEARLPHPVAVLHGVFEDLRRDQVHLHLRPLGPGGFKHTGYPVLRLYKGQKIQYAISHILHIIDLCPQ